jgi:hypothetical protein
MVWSVEIEPFVFSVFFLVGQKGWQFPAWQQVELAFQPRFSQSTQAVHTISDVWQPEHLPCWKY